MAKGEARAAEKVAMADQRRVEQERQRQWAARTKAEMGGLWSRRDVFGRFGWSIFAAFSGISLLAALRSAFPRVLFQPPTSFKAGWPADFTIGEVNTKFQKDQRVWLVREDEGMYAIFAKCTHLGCTPAWLTAENKFKCPCHGSGFYKSGINFEGPAPRPLERVRITKAEDGQIVVDKGVKYLYEKGEWGKPGSFLKA
jgi:cytochrome b6-f complex iron-sulfur subunit